MSNFLSWLQSLVSSWKCWIIVAPWEIGVRVRLGKIAASMAPGPHFRIPLLDEIVLVNTRLRIDPVPSVTVAGPNAIKARVLSGSVGYRISDPAKVLLTLNHPTSAVVAFAQASMCKLILADECEQELREEFADKGIEILFVRYVEDVEVRTYRFLQNNGGGVYGSPLGSSGPLGKGVTSL